MSVALAQGCQGADSMWSGEAKPARCHSDNRFPYFWLCFEFQVLQLLVLEVGVQGHNILPQQAAGSRDHTETARAWGRASALEAEPARGLGWKYPKEQAFWLVLLQKLKDFLLFQQWGALGTVRGSCSIPAGSSHTAFSFTVHFLATLPTGCHL